MTKNIQYYLGITLLMPITAIALENIPVLNRPIAYEGQLGNFELWGQYDYTGKDLDFLSSVDNEDTSYIKQHNNYLAGLNLGLYKGLSLRYHYLYSEQNAVRALEPKVINTQYDGHDVRLEYSWDFSPSWYLNIQTGFRNHQVTPLNFYSYQSSDITLNTLKNAAGVPIPVLSIASSDSAYLFAASISKSFSQDIQITLGLEGRFVDVSASFNSEVSSLFKGNIPQKTPWQEQHLIATAAFEWQMWEYISVAMDFKHYQIWRENYQAKAGRQDYNSNQQFDFYLFAHAYKGLTLYGHAQIMTHYLLGEVPLVYNTRTNHKFDKAYGFVSAGISYSF